MYMGGSMSENSTQEKTEKASPQKLKQARQKGQVPRAKDICSAIIFLLVCGYFAVNLNWIWEQVSYVFALSFTFSMHDVTFYEAALERLGLAIGIIILLMVPLMVVIWIGAFFGSMLVGGWIFSTENLIPKLDKIDPVKGIKRIFSTKSFSELVKSSLKIVVIFSLLWHFLNSNLADLASISRLPINTAIITGMGYFFEAVLLYGIALFLIGIIDVPYQRYEFGKEMRMTKQEVREEYKNTEGNPQIKQRVRQIQQKMAQRKMEVTVPSADVVITNPTHYAVAIKYDTKLADAPFVVAKGVDESALVMRRIAKENGVEVVESPSLARAVYHTTSIDQAIPSQLYVAVAHVLTYVLQLKQFQAQSQGDKPKFKSVPLPLDMQFKQ